MDEPTQQIDSVEETELPDIEEPITSKVVLSGVAAGIAGLLAMTPVIAGVPMLLGVFQFESLAEFGNLVIAEPNAVLGVAFFVVGGAVVLPLFFVVTASFLPPYEPSYFRGVTISSMFWVSFAFLFWPAETAFVNGAFLVVTLVAHWIYGAVLGIALHKINGIPEHDV